jgi:hypothetical protein
LELQPVVVSEIPNDKEELEAYLRLTGLPGVRVSKQLANVRRRCRQMFFTSVVVNYQRRETKGQTMIYKALHR